MKTTLIYISIGVILTQCGLEINLNLPGANELINEDLLNTIFF